ncbi:nuclear transport factor 2 family protein [Streptosporangium sp. NPDC020072]|uniref:nuclear transport factor 2 family protein n=1 Tax=unclassified Streptosporangium TaxID=2632669 RepID=UPI00341CE2B3
MREVTAPPDLYARIQQFHATQMHALDGGEFDAYAETFTEDGEFRHTPGRPAARTRAGIAEELKAFHRERFAGDPVQRRHWFNMLRVEPGSGGEIHATFYVLVVATRPGVRQPEIAPSCVVHDVLVEDADGGLLVRSRWVEHDWQPEPATTVGAAAGGPVNGPVNGEVSR